MPVSNNVKNGNSGGGGTGITELISSDGSIVIINSTGPTADVKLPQKINTSADVVFGSVSAGEFIGDIGNSSTGFDPTTATPGVIANTIFQNLYDAIPAVGVTSITSTGSTVIITNATGPIVNIELPQPLGTTSNPSFATVAAATITGALTGSASGNTTYSANNHGVVLSSATNAMNVVTPDASTTKVFVSGGVSADPSWQLINNAMLPASNQTSSGDFNATVALSGWIIPGTAPAITTHFERQGNTMLIQIKIVPAGGLNTVAATAVTSTIIGLPVVAGALPMGISVADLVTSAAIGNGIVLAASSVIQMPSIGATTDTLIISGTYSLV